MVSPSLKRVILEDLSAISARASMVVTRLSRSTLISTNAASNLTASQQSDIEYLSTQLSDLRAQVATLSLTLAESGDEIPDISLPALRKALRSAILGATHNGIITADTTSSKKPVELEDVILPPKSEDSPSEDFTTPKESSSKSKINRVELLTTYDVSCIKDIDNPLVRQELCAILVEIFESNSWTPAPFWIEVINQKGFI